MSAGFLTLADISFRTDMLVITCKRCERSGRYMVARLIAHHGQGFAVPELLRLLSADCPKQGAANAYDRCGAQFLSCRGCSCRHRSGNKATDAAASVQSVYILMSFYSRGLW